MKVRVELRGMHMCLGWDPPWMVGGRDTWEGKQYEASLRGITLGLVSGRAVWGWGLQPGAAQLDPRPGRVLTGGADPGTEVNG